MPISRREEAESSSTSWTDALSKARIAREVKTTVLESWPHRRRRDTDRFKTRGLRKLQKAPLGVVQLQQSYPAPLAV